MTSEKPWIAIGAAGALALIAVLAIVTTRSNHHNGSMDHSSMNTRPPGTPRAEVDAAFVRQMIPHHQLAVEMATVARQNAKHSEIKTLAAAVHAAQTRAIAQLRKIARSTGVELGQTSGMMAADAATMGMSMNDMGMAMDMHGVAEADAFDRASTDGTLPHHQWAIAMAKAELSGGSSADLKATARAIIAAQNTEIAQKRRWRMEWYDDAASPTSGSGSSMQHMSGM